ncbi:mucin-5AC-like [Ostrea edulis]|uniref:mucin-5AC-like n=1 Tax=Ostrea edulis TaxID=37623 RepID=UPI0024AFD620|nr:mucin-5AC-like [Ostrea edulis]
MDEVHYKPTWGGLPSPTAKVRRKLLQEYGTTSAAVAGPSATTFAGPSATTSAAVAGPSATTSVAGPSATTSVAGPSATTSVAGPSAMTSAAVAGPLATTSAWATTTTLASVATPCATPTAEPRLLSATTSTPLEHDLDAQSAGSRDLCSPQEDCNGKLTNAGVHQKTRMVLDVDNFYNMAGEYLSCPKCSKKVISWSEGILKQLDNTTRNQFPCILTA